MVRTDRQPYGTLVRFGTEIELVGMSSRQAREHLVDQLGTGALDNAGRPWTVVDDVSIPDGFEIVSPPLARDDLPLLESIFLRLRAAGARPAPGRAGLHVHVDATPFGPCELRNLIVHWGNLEPTLAHLFRVHPRRAVRYCRPVLSFARAVAEETSGGQGDIVAIWSENWCADSQAARRHRSLNLESYKSLGTIEFRLFGSMHRGEELRAVVLTVIGLAAGALDHACSARFAPDDLPRSRAEAVKTIVALGRRLSLAPADWHAVTRVLGHYVSKNTYGAGRHLDGVDFKFGAARISSTHTQIAEQMSAEGIRPGSHSPSAHAWLKQPWTSLPT